MPVRSAEQPTACMSFNYHREHFGTAWNLHKAALDGTTSLAIVSASNTRGRRGLRRAVLALAGPPPARIPGQQRESVRAGIAGHEHGDGQFVLDPKTGVLGVTWYTGTWCLAAFSAARTEDVLLQRTRHVVTRRRDHLIDKKIGSVIRMQRVKLGLSQTDLGNALGVTFQQIQKYENGTNAVASTRISDLCRALRDDAE